MMLQLATLKSNSAPELNKAMSAYTAAISKTKDIKLSKKIYREKDMYLSETYEKKWQQS